MLVQIDGSPHRWFGRDGPELTLLAAIDDATGKVLGALFREREDAQGYFLLIRMIVEKYGCPLAVYRDRHGIFQRGKNRDLTIAEQLENQPNHTQFGRLLRELGIESIASHSPQSKGRIERLFGTFQDRLVSELRLARIRNLKDANVMLPAFLARYNRRFSVTPQQPGSVYRQCAATDLNTIFSFKYVRTVGLDNTLRFRQHRIQIESDRHRASYARTRVEVQERMDGSLAVYYRGRCLATTDAPLEAPVLRLLATIPLSSLQYEPAVSEKSSSAETAKPRAQWKPSKDHPWLRRRRLLWDPRFIRDFK